MTPEELSNSDLPIRDYELAFLIGAAPDATKVVEILAHEHANITYQSPITQVRLSYTIKKHDIAFFGFIQFTGTSSAAEKLKEVLGMEPTILRSLLVKPPSKYVAKQTKPSPPAPEPKRPEPKQPEMLTNEALEKKLEEILK